MSDDDWREKLRVPSWCPICQLVMKGSKSNYTYYDFGCCSNCHIQFVEGREERWGTGWRPDAGSIVLYIERLTKSNITD